MVYNEEDYIDSAEYILRNVLRAKVQLVTYNTTLELNSFA
jgi:hypothetical protein